MYIIPKITGIKMDVLYHLLIEILNKINQFNILLVERMFTLSII